MTMEIAAVTRRRKETQSNFGFWLRRQIELRDMTQTEFAQRAGATTGMVSQWILGRRRPSTDSVDRIADALRIDMDEVLVALGVGSMPVDDPPHVRRIIDLLRRCNVTSDREAGLVALLETWISADERRRIG